MTFITDLFRPSKAHRLGLDYSADAEAMYRQIASDLGLEIVKEPNDQVELSMTFPKQEKLRTDVWVCLQNLDELWFEIDGFTCSMFPYEEIKDEFESHLRQTLSGEYRIRKFIRRNDGHVFKSLLQQHIGDQWVTIYRYGKFISWLPTVAYDVQDETLRASEVDEIISAQNEP